MLTEAARRLYSVTIDRSKFREKFSRIAVFAVPLFFWGREPWWAGLIVAASGVLIRAWAAGFLHKDESVASAGPYLVIRHPLYLGSCLLALGFIITLHHWAVTLILGGLTMATYVHTIRHEEDNLLKRFGQAYREHMRRTGPLWPKWEGVQLFFSSPSRRSGFSVKQYLYNREYECLLGVAAVFGYIALGTMYPNFWTSLVESLSF